MTIKMLIPTVALAFVLSACASDPRNANQMAFDDAVNFNKLSAQRIAKAHQDIADLSDDDVRQRLTDKLSDVTAIIKQTGHGIYVEYTAPDGRLFMWYPGNVGTVTGTWGISEDISRRALASSILAPIMA